MSVNRFEIMPLLCATPEALSDAPADGRVSIIVDIRGDWEAANIRARALFDSRTTRDPKGRTLLRIRMPSDDDGEEGLGKLAALQPDGFVLSGCGRVADIQKLDVMLRVAETEHGLQEGAIRIFAEVGEKAEFFLSEPPLRNVSERLQGLIFDGAALAESTSSQVHNIAAGRTGAPMLFARATAVLKARQAGLVCYELLTDAPLSANELRTVQTSRLPTVFRV
jgi:citrate lyase subunit beta / citryl-CoA lyase